MPATTSPPLPSIRLPQSLTDGVVLLDAHLLEDAEAHLAGEDAEMRRRFDAERPASIDGTRVAIGRWIEGRRNGGPMFAYAMRLPSGELIGGCELRMRSPVAASVSYWVFRRFRGHGYAVRALSLLCAAAPYIKGLQRLEARIAPDNERSRRVVEKGGFVEGGRVRERGPRGNSAIMVLYVRPIAAAGPD